jgi:uncharacterized tellurite resistance protein B-like protein
MEAEDSKKKLTNNMEQQPVTLKNYSDREKGAYLGAIASIATADQSASEEELEYLMALADSAELPEDQRQVVQRAALETSADELKRCLDILKTSELRFSLVADLISFAKADDDYTPEERANIENIAQQLNINQQQFSLLDEFAEKTNDQEVQQLAATGKAGDSSFLSQLGLGGLAEKAKNSGINLNSLLSIAGPIILGTLVSRGMRGRGGGGGLLGGLGGLLGGLGGGLLGGRGGGGGLGSLIGMLSGGRGYKKSGGFLGGLF